MNAINADGETCFLHLHTKECVCVYHCTGCDHAYGPLRPDCCTCCKGHAARIEARKA